MILEDYDTGQDQSRCFAYWMRTQDLILWGELLQMLVNLGSSSGRAWRMQTFALGKICAHCQGRKCIAWACTLKESGYSGLLLSPPRTLSARC